MKGFYRFLFLLSSFGPLFAILGVKVWLSHGIEHWLVTTAAAFFVFSAISLWIVIRSFNSGVTVRHRIIDVRPRDNDVMSYLMTYIPLLIFRDITDPVVWIPLAILYALIFLIYFLLEAPFVNPGLAALGYRLYEGRMADSRTLFMVFADRKSFLVESEEVMMREIANSSVYYATGD